MKTTLLIDGDILAYQAAASVEEKSDWGDGVKSVTVGNPKLAESNLKDTIERLHETLGVEEGIVCLSCPTVECFRMDVLPTYKGNRTDVAKPQLLPHIRDYIRENYKTKEVARLEADDVMGILSTHPALIPGKKIIVSSDKDMKTIPGWLYSPYKKTFPSLLTKEVADFWHMRQTLTGDDVDGYSGCPGVGDDTADRFLAGRDKVSPYDHTFTRGPRKGTTEVRWSVEPSASDWETVVSLYNKAGLTEEDALVQARVARILRHTDYDFKNKTVKLWEPPKIS